MCYSTGLRAVTLFTLVASSHYNVLQSSLYLLFFQTRSVSMKLALVNVQEEYGLTMFSAWEMKLSWEIVLLMP